MSISLIKRIELLEKAIPKTKRNDIPDMIFITFLEDKKNYEIQEQFFNNNGVDSKYCKVQKLEDYYISCDFKGGLFIELEDGFVSLSQKDLNNIRSEKYKYFKILTVEELNENFKITIGILNGKEN